jgi:hypothetical protein
MALNCHSHAPSEERSEYEMLRDARVAELVDKFKMVEEAVANL